MPTLVDGSLLVSGDLFVYGNIAPPPTAGGILPLITVMNVISNVNVFGTLVAQNDIVAFSSLCDGRYKSNIMPLEDSLEVIRALQPVSFTWGLDLPLAKPGKPGTRDIGLIAQDVEKVEPLAVNEVQDFKTIDWSRLVPHLIQTIQSLDKRIIELENVRRE
jgi:hypothetical protein